MSDVMWVGMASVLVSTVGQLMLRAGMQQIGPVQMANAAQAGLQVVRSGWVVGGLFLYVIGAFLWMVVLSRATLSHAFPMTAVKYVFTPLLAAVWFGEAISRNNALGVAVILIGIWLTYR